MFMYLHAGAWPRNSEVAKKSETPKGLWGKKRNFTLFIMQLSLKSSQEVLLLLDVCFDQIKRLKKWSMMLSRKKWEL